MENVAQAPEINSKISSGYLSRGAVVTIRQSTLGKVHGHREQAPSV
jgi:hypothetical protein